jgi:hypothetical protein
MSTNHDNRSTSNQYSKERTTNRPIESINQSCSCAKFTQRRHREKISESYLICRI